LHNSEEPALQEDGINFNISEQFILWVLGMPVLYRIKSKQLFGAVHPEWCLDADDDSQSDHKAESNRKEKNMETKINEKDMIQELLEIVKKLDAEEQKHLFWLGQGILFAQKNGQKS